MQVAKRTRAPMSQGKALIEGALNGYLPSVPAERSSYEAVPVGPSTSGSLRRVPGLTWGDHDLAVPVPVPLSAHEGGDDWAPTTNHRLPPGYDPEEYILDQSDETCVPLGYRAGSNIRTPRG